MPRIGRLKIKGKTGVYHVMSRTALDGLVLGSVEKEFFLNLVKRLSKVYFAEVLGFSIMGNHFHLLIRMHRGDEVSEEEIKERIKLYYGGDDKCGISDEKKLQALRKKWGDLSEYVKEIKQGFSRFYNKRHGRKGYFWSERFKSVIVDNGETLINCLAYIDLNAYRASLVKRPESYRWCSLGYHVQSNNADRFLSLDFGLREFAVKGTKERLTYYHEFVYAKGGIRKGGKEKVKGIDLRAVERFRYRTRYFTDSGIIGTKDFVERIYQEFKDNFTSKHEKRPKVINGLEGIFSLKRLSEAI